MKVACTYNCTDMMMQCRVNEQALISNYITQSDFTLSYTNGVGRDFELLCLGSTKNGLISVLQMVKCLIWCQRGVAKVLNFKLNFQSMKSNSSGTFHQQEQSNDCNYKQLPLGLEHNIHSVTTF